MTDEARKRLLQIIPHIRRAIKHATLAGTQPPMLGIMSVGDGEIGKITAQFEAESFFADLALVVGAPPYQVEPTEAFLDRIYAPGCDEVFEILKHLDTLSCDGEFTEIDRILALCDVSRLSGEALFCLISSSGHVREKLTSREAFLDRAEPRLVEVDGVEGAADLMEGQRGTDLSDTAAARDALSPFLGFIPR